MGASNIEPKRDTNIENSILNENIPSINKNELSKNIGLSLVGFNLNSVAMDPLACYWNKYNSQLGIPIFNTTDVRKWSVHDVASYIQKVLEYKSNTNQDTSIPDQFINQVYIYYYFYCCFIYCLTSDYFI